MYSATLASAASSRQNLHWRNGIFPYFFCGTGAVYWVGPCGLSSILFAPRWGNPLLPANSIAGSDYGWSRDAGKTNLLRVCMWMMPELRLSNFNCPPTSPPFSAVWLLLGESLREVDLQWTSWEWTLGAGWTGCSKPVGGASYGRDEATAWLGLLTRDGFCLLGSQGTYVLAPNLNTCQPLRKTGSLSCRQVNVENTLLTSAALVRNASHALFSTLSML